jgi:hypothetical protein
MRCSQPVGYPLAYIMKNPSPAEICYFSGTACAVSFQLEVVPDIRWVSIAEISVVVNSYQPLPKYSGVLPRPFEEAHVYYVEIDNPALANRNKFHAEYVFQSDQKRRVGIIRLENGKPELFVVRINVKTKGVYNFDVHVNVSHKQRKQSVAIASSVEFLFDV